MLNLITSNNDLADRLLYGSVDAFVEMMNPQITRVLGSDEDDSIETDSGGSVRTPDGDSEPDPAEEPEPSAAAPARQKNDIFGRGRRRQGATRSHGSAPTFDVNTSYLPGETGSEYNARINAAHAAYQSALAAWNAAAHAPPPVVPPVVPPTETPPVTTPTETPPVTTPTETPPVTTPTETPPVTTPTETPPVTTPTERPSSLDYINTSYLPGETGSEYNARINAENAAYRDALAAWEAARRTPPADPDPPPAASPDPDPPPAASPDPETPRPSSEDYINTDYLPGETGSEYNARINAEHEQYQRDLATWEAARQTPPVVPPGPPSLDTSPIVSPDQLAPVEGEDTFETLNRIIRIIESYDDDQTGIILQDVVDDAVERNDVELIELLAEKYEHVVHDFRVGPDDVYQGSLGDYLKRYILTQQYHVAWYADQSTIINALNTLHDPSATAEERAKAATLLKFASEKYRDKGLNIDHDNDPNTDPIDMGQHLSDILASGIAQTASQAIDDDAPPPDPRLDEAQADLDNAQDAANALKEQSAELRQAVQLAQTARYAPGADYQPGSAIWNQLVATRTAYSRNQRDIAAANDRVEITQAALDATVQAIKDDDLSTDAASDADDRTYHGAFVERSDSPMLSGLPPGSYRGQGGNWKYTATGSPELSGTFTIEKGRGGNRWAFTPDNSRAFGSYMDGNEWRGLPDLVGSRTPTATPGQVAIPQSDGTEQPMPTPFAFLLSPEGAQWQKDNPDERVIPKEVFEQWAQERSPTVGPPSPGQVAIPQSDGTTSYVPANSPLAFLVSPEGRQWFDDNPRETRIPTKVVSDWAQGRTDQPMPTPFAFLLSPEGAQWQKDNPDERVIPKEVFEQWAQEQSPTTGPPLTPPFTDPEGTALPTNLVEERSQGLSGKLIDVDSIDYNQAFITHRRALQSAIEKLQTDGTQLTRENVIDRYFYERDGNIALGPKRERERKAALWGEIRRTLGESDYEGDNPWSNYVPMPAEPPPSGRVRSDDTEQPMPTPFAFLLSPEGAQWQKDNPDERVIPKEVFERWAQERTDQASVGPLPGQVAIPQSDGTTMYLDANNPLAFLVSPEGAQWMKDNPDKTRIPAEVAANWAQRRTDQASMEGANTGSSLSVEAPAPSDADDRTYHGAFVERSDSPMLSGLPPGSYRGQGGNWKYTATGSPELSGTFTIEKGRGGNRWAFTPDNSRAFGSYMDGNEWRGLPDLVGSRTPTATPGQVAIPQSDGTEQPMPTPFAFLLSPEGAQWQKDNPDERVIPKEVFEQWAQERSPTVGPPSPGQVAIPHSDGTEQPMPTPFAFLLSPEGAQWQKDNPDERVIPKEVFEQWARERAEPSTTVFTDAAGNPRTTESVVKQYGMIVLGQSMTEYAAQHGLTIAPEYRQLATETVGALASTGASLGTPPPLGSSGSINPSYTEWEERSQIPMYIKSDGELLDPSKLDVGNWYPGKETYTQFAARYGVDVVPNPDYVDPGERPNQYLDGSGQLVPETWKQLVEVYQRDGTTLSPADAQDLNSLAQLNPSALDRVVRATAGPPEVREARYQDAVDEWNVTVNVPPPVSEDSDGEYIEGSHGRSRLWQHYRNNAAMDLAMTALASGRPIPDWLKVSGMYKTVSLRDAATPVELARLITQWREDEKAAEKADDDDVGGGGSRDYAVADDGTVSYTVGEHTYTVKDEDLSRDVRDAMASGDASLLSSSNDVTVSDR